MRRPFFDPVYVCCESGPLRRGPRFTFGISGRLVPGDLSERGVEAVLIHAPTTRTVLPRC